MTRSRPGWLTPGCAGCGRFPTPGYTAGGYGAATPAPWSTGRRAGIRCTRCCPRRSPRSSTWWFASDFAAEIGVRNYPRLAVFSGDLRGAVHARSQWPSPSVEAVRGDQVGDLLAGDRGRDQPGRGRPQVAHRRIDGDRDTAHGQGRRLGRAGTQTGTTWHA